MADTAAAAAADDASSGAEDFEYHEVDPLELTDEDDGDAEDLTAALASLRLRHAPKGNSGEPETTANDGGINAEAAGHVVTQVRPEVVEDFVRNFLIKAGLSRTLDLFNAEWYELQAKGRLPEAYTTRAPDVYLRNDELDEQVGTLRAQLGRVQEVAERAQGTWDKFRKERDFHRLHHKRVAQEKARLVVDLKRLKKHYRAYESTLQELQRRYQVAMKEKMLMKLERDRLRARLTMLEAQAQATPGTTSANVAGTGTAKSMAAPRRAGALPSVSTGSSWGDPSPNGSYLPAGAVPAGSGAAAAAAAAAAAGKRRQNDSRLPPDDAPGSVRAVQDYPIGRVDSFTAKKSHRGHQNAVSALAFHPRKPVVATASDDETWKLWSVPNCELVMSGEGHSAWIAGIDFSPGGGQIATASGDGTVKLWDLARASCAATFTDHTQAVWGVAWHHAGDFLASASMDHTARLLDAHSLRCRVTFRGHVDSVNAICWQPLSNGLVTASGDKTVSLWDARTGLCVQTFYGHANAVNHACASRDGNVVASCDADGAARLWDVRMVAEMAVLDGGQHALNRVTFDRSGERLVAAGDDGIVKVFDVPARSLLAELRGHEEAVQCVALSPGDEYLVSGASDCTFRVWS